MAPHRQAVWALHVPPYIELYNMHPFEPEAERLADFREEDFRAMTKMNIPADNIPRLIRLYGEYAGHQKRA